VNYWNLLLIMFMVIMLFVSWNIIEMANTCKDFKNTLTEKGCDAWVQRVCGSNRFNVSIFTWDGNVT